MAGDGVIELVRIYNAVAGQQIGAHVLKSALTANTDYYLGINHSYFNGVLLDRRLTWHYTIKQSGLLVLHLLACLWLCYCRRIRP